MWCAQCKQDVTAGAIPILACPDCGEPLDEQPSLSTRSGLDADLAAVLGENDPVDPLVDLTSPDFAPSFDPDDDEALGGDGWDEQMDAIETLLAEVKSASAPPHWYSPQPMEAELLPSSTTESESVAGRIRWTTWLVISTGLMLFVCGAVLLGCSALSERRELWRIGLPLAFFGQATLIVGVLLQLESLWATERDVRQRPNIWHAPSRPTPHLRHAKPKSATNDRRQAS